MDILLWRWSITAQLTSAFMIAVFFVTLSRSIRRPEVFWWTRAWLANLVALLFTLVFWYFQPLSRVELVATRSGYLAAKIAFVLLLITGAGVVRLSTRNLVLAVAIYAFLGGIFLDSIPLLGLVQHGILAVVFIATAVILVRDRSRRVIWFIAGLLVRAAIGLAEAAAYALSSGNGPLHDRAASFVAVSSSFDTGAEWILALGCVLMISERVQSELRDSNRDLLAAQEELRALADRDPLTGLANRRSLPAVFRAVQPQGATLLFFDLDEFKSINDLHGHGTGDECLRRFATALQACFRPDDAIVRYGGDEFLVVASGLDSESIDVRIKTLRARVREATFDVPAVLFSVGVAELKPGGVPDDALHAADQAMYAAKEDVTIRPRGRRSR